MKKFFFICLFVLAALPLQADPIIVGEGPLVNSGGLSVNYSQWVAKQFTLSAGFNVTNISVWGSLGTNTVLYVTTALNSNSVLFQQAVSGAGPINVPMSLTLGAGAYYLVLGVTSPGGGGWWSGPANHTHIGTGGTPGNTFAAYNPFGGPVQQSLNSTWYSQGDYPTVFTVNGTQVPEPGSLLLFGTVLLATGLARRSRS